jgi:hypothetical protein
MDAADPKDQVDSRRASDRVRRLSTAAPASEQPFGGAPCLNAKLRQISSQASNSNKPQVNGKCQFAELIYSERHATLPKSY